MIQTANNIADETLKMRYQWEVSGLEDTLCSASDKLKNAEYDSRIFLEIMESRKEKGENT